MRFPQGTVWQQNRQHWALSCISKNRASWFTRVPVLQQLPPTAEQEGAAGPHEGWSGSWGQCRVFLANGSLSTWETRSPENELYVHFQQHWNKQPPQNSFPNPLVTPVNHQAEGGPPLWGGVSRQGYPGSLGSGSRVLLKAMFLQNISARKN